MKLTLIIFCAFVALSISSCGGSDSSSSNDATNEVIEETTVNVIEYDSTDEASFVVEVHDLINAHRVSLELDALEYDERLQHIARPHNIYLVETAQDGFIEANHDNFDQRAEAMINLGYVIVGENVAVITDYQNVAETLVQAWLSSPSHRAAIENPDFAFTGIDVYVDTETQFIYATQLFADVYDPDDYVANPVFN